MLTSNLTLVPEVQFEVVGSLSSTPSDNRLRFTPLLPDRVKLSAGKPWTAISGDIECWLLKPEGKRKGVNRKDNLELLTTFHMHILTYSIKIIQLTFMIAKHS
jgi:hypothetical protein